MIQAALGPIFDLFTKKPRLTIALASGVAAGGIASVLVYSCLGNSCDSIANDMQN